MVEPNNPPALLLVLHDVAPCTWADYQPFVEAIDALGGVPLSWLVVPDFHRRNALDTDPTFRQRLSERAARGDELVLHGYFHDDQEPRPSTPKHWLMRRVYTHEGEFYQLSRETALARLRAGIEMFQRYDWPLHGFVAPAWLMSEGTRLALRELPLSYTSDPQHLYRLPDFTAINAPGLVWSARSAWRRGLSKLVCEQREQRWRHTPVIRLGVHPVDMRHRFSRDYWLHTVERLLNEGRVPMTKIDWLTQQHNHPGYAA
ncbi:polysaccharide deacetylase family protein [Pseudomonas koreensis]|uniref:Polysaccharide deacetylase family protein n=1 Tax=Pseudomonas koreensis TaxID=198620 RepID=A0A9X2XGT5_9PSED|nr:polysaccharide deacetylase family protein [Pseudomonas koreensis]MCU7248426.1 polysaccharide deacetylase family protein [Pseudomonas koreensis]